MDWAILIAFAALSLWLYVALAWRSRTAGLTWTGTDGPYVGDQMQYLGWIRDAADNLRIGNLFRLESASERFIHPGLAISGVLTRIGLSPAFAYMVWKPVAVVTLFLATRAYCRRLLSDPVPRTVALVLALFAFAPMPTVFSGLHIGDRQNVLRSFGMALDMWPGLYLWGYPFTAIAVALIPITLLVYERARRDGRLRLGPPLCGLLCAWLQPWQGGVLLLVLLGAEVLLWRRERRSGGALLIGVTLGATALPLAYYALLGRFDASWRLAGQANRFDPWPWWSLPLFFLPIAVVIALEYRRPARTFQDIAVRVWPAASIAIYWFITYTPFGTFPLHSLQGLSIPVAVLAVRGVTSLSPSWKSPLVLGLLAAILVACLGLPLVRELRSAKNAATQTDESRLGAAPWFLRSGERRALDYLEHDPRRGGVLSRGYLGETLPGLTGRRTWVGIISFTPDPQRRYAVADQLFTGRIPAPAARRFVRATGARFLLSDCRPSADMQRLLGAMVLDVHRFGCAAVYRLS